MPPVSRAREFFSAYTQDLTSDELGKVFTRDAPEAYRFFTRGIDSKAFKALPRHTRILKWTQAFFMAFTMRLTPARRAIYGVALVAAAFGVLSLSRGISVFGVPIVIPPFIFRIGIPTLAFAPGTNWLILAFALMNLIVLLEVFDRLSLKRDLEVAREIQLAMLPDGTWSAPGVEASGLTRPANTVGGDFYDILPQPDGRVIVALGDVAGKASPAALLMALFLAMLRTLVDEHSAPAELVRRLNIQVSKHAPPSRFITLFLGLFDPLTGEIEFVNAGQTPPLLLRAGGEVERLSTGGIALAMFEASTYESGRARLGPGDALVMYSDGITESESPAGIMFEDTGLEAAVRATPGVAAAVLSRAVFSAVDKHRQGERLADDLTVLVLSRPVVPPVPAVTLAAQIP
ncbi:MAG TPA: PP2C family protein-serine/threonine phosphatase [Vicinamibacterales bacterium]|nr:PP2C family protein-serine/threonine phosphatase [Vicinamibacterales bacterium]